MIRFIFVFFALVFCLAPYPAFCQKLKAQISAPYAVLMNAETGQILYEKNPHTPRFPASTTKIATAWFALSKKTGLEEVYVASQEALGCVSAEVRRSKHPSYRLEHGGSHMGLKGGEKLSYRDLLYGLMLSSGNDAANVIAEFVSGTVPAFMKELNAFLKENGCHETHFSNPHGLHAQDHVTSAHDLAVMARHAMKNPVLREIVKAQSYVKEATNKQEKTTLVQHNALLKSGGAHYYAKATGIKTGYTLAAGPNLVASAKDPNRSLIAVVLNCASAHERFRDATLLFEAAFNEARVRRTLFARGFDLFSLKVKGAKAPLEASLQEDVHYEYYPSEEPAFKAELKWHLLELPIQKGQHVGDIEIRDEKTGNVLQKGAILANRAVDMTLAHRAFSFMKKLGQGPFFFFLGATLLSVSYWVILRKRAKKNEKIS